MQRQGIDRTKTPHNGGDAPHGASRRLHHSPTTKGMKSRLEPWGMLEMLILKKVVSGVSLPVAGPPLAV